MPIPRSRGGAQHQTHRLPPGSIDAMLRRQGGRCLICGAELKPGRFVVDHDHRIAELEGHDPAHGCPGCVRGLLDAKCNALLGFAGDDADRLARAAAYVRLARERHDF